MAEKPFTNSHSAHPGRETVECPLAECITKRHLPYTQIAKQHRAKAIRKYDRRPDDEWQMRALYMQVKYASDLRTARKAAVDAWRALHKDGPYPSLRDK